MSCSTARHASMNDSGWLPECQEADTRRVGLATVPSAAAWASSPEDSMDGDPRRGVPMRLRHRMVLGLLTAALAVPAPANRWLLVYAGLALVVLVPRGPLLVQPVVQGQPAVDGQVLAGDIARPGVAEQEQGDPGDVGGHAGLAGGDARPQAGVLGHLLRRAGVLPGPGRGG